VWGTSERGSDVLISRVLLRNVGAVLVGQWAEARHTVDSNFSRLKMLLEGRQAVLLEQTRDFERREANLLKERMSALQQYSGVELASLEHALEADKSNWPTARFEQSTGSLEQGIARSGEVVSVPLNSKLTATPVTSFQVAKTAGSLKVGSNGGRVTGTTKPKNARQGGIRHQGKGDQASKSSLSSGSLPDATKGRPAGNRRGGADGKPRGVPPKAQHPRASVVKPKGLSSEPKPQRQNRQRSKGRGGNRGLAAAPAAGSKVSEA
jgi:hypothetical protein